MQGESAFPLRIARKLGSVYARRSGNTSYRNFVTEHALRPTHLGAQFIADLVSCWVGARLDYDTAWRRIREMSWDEYEQYGAWQGAIARGFNTRNR
jgi:hypothetical protein